jgi:hypothetical protein
MVARNSASDGDDRGRAAAALDSPPMNWSTLMYAFGLEKEDSYAEEETDAG